MIETHTDKGSKSQEVLIALKRPPNLSHDTFLKPGHDHYDHILLHLALGLSFIQRSQPNEVHVNVDRLCISYMEPPLRPTMFINMKC